MEFNIIDSLSTIGMIEKRQLALFLHEHLDKYSEPVETILMAMDYALQETSVNGGFIITATENEQLLGAVVYNRTGMQDYAPPNMLVYIAVRKDLRNRGIGSKLLTKSLKIAKGEVKLHVDPENPAISMLQKFGFESKYLEYRLKR